MEPWLLVLYGFGAYVGGIVSMVLLGYLVILRRRRTMTPYKSRAARYSLGETD